MSNKHCGTPFRSLLAGNDTRRANIHEFARNFNLSIKENQLEATKDFS